MDTNKRFHSLVDCIYDLKTRKLSTGIELDIYPDVSQLQFKIGQNVLYEFKHRVLKEVEIVDITYEYYELEVSKGDKLNKWYREYFKDTVFQSDELYCIKNWIPFYKLSDGSATRYEYELYSKEQ